MAVVITTKAHKAWAFGFGRRRRYGESVAAIKRKNSDI
jgi:hypothetical protein